MFIFRGKKKGQQVWVEGELHKQFYKHEDEDYSGYAIKPTYTTSQSVEPESLSVSYTGLIDKNCNQIFASFEVDGKMSIGGDIVRTDRNRKKWIVAFKNLELMVRLIPDTKYKTIEKYSIPKYLTLLKTNGANIEIIGKQWELK